MPDVHLDRVGRRESSVSEGRNGPQPTSTCLWKLMEDRLEISKLVWFSYSRLPTVL